MAIFNSLGSNYTFSFCLKALTAKDNPKYNRELQELLAERYKGRAVLTSQGRQAILLALKLLKLPEGSFVAINGFTCFAVYEAVKNAGLNVEYLDIEKDSLDFSSQTLQKKIKENPKIKVVLIQNTLGFPCLISEIAKVCRQNEIYLIEDLAHSIGLTYPNGEEAGTVGDFTALSFSQDKVVDGVLGGALIIRNKKFQSKIDSLHDAKFSNKLRLYPLLTLIIRRTYQFGLGKLLHFLLKNIGVLKNPMETISNGKVTSLANQFADLTIQQLTHPSSGGNNLEVSLSHRQQIFQIYQQNINPKLLLYKLDNHQSIVSLRFPLMVENRDSLISYLKKQQIYISDTWYDSPIAPKKYLSQTDYKNQCPNSEKVCQKVVNLPTHTNISIKDANRICQLINLWYEKQ